ncbi:regulator of G-protein signaling loco-like [Dermacentor andersoni]|uniref:regulator of G-protein signaling loco-like n=1 Tax=Dermacentor andersoni TaxID=34620 RepID=UPI002155D391|nr:regulator of G-protein signaling loco-like [Dermacentor andersoni]XP_054917349.1 regulator of G-protein signaling loco-like [Dermacentor andersoni]XP_054917350.1 regulator of G-protein signaling loco-like [Dermacentor andersoni]
MHQTRRRKKRPSYGVRTVELSRGKKGFGFTISGQAPCILSCIVAGSPAERVGLRPGDFLVAVNGHNVSRAPHDDVVRRIGSSSGPLKLQIAENYYSDSSDEEAATPGRTHHTRPRHRHVPRLAARDAHGLFPPSTNQADSNKALLELILEQKGLRTSLVLRTVVGYLGTIELPREVAGSRLQAIRSCVRRLRLEQKVHTLVQLSVLRDGVLLADLRGAALARFPAERIAFSAAYADDSRFLGLVTKGADGALSCHVLMVDSRLRLPPGVLRAAPLHTSAEPILRAVAALYHRADGPNASPQPSQAGSSNSSNSDSGIGFRDEGNSSDRVLVVDVENQPRFQSFSLDRQGALPACPDTERLRARAMPDSVGVSGEAPLALPDWVDSSPLGGSLLDDTLTAADPCPDGESVDLQSSTKGEDGSSSATPRRNESSCSSNKNWTRSSSLRRHQRRSHHRRSTHEAGTVSDGEVTSEKLSMSSSVQSLEQASDSSSTCDQPRGRVGRWLAGFDELLHDPLGLLVFAEFLKKEFSQENIFFWVVCEQYRKMLDRCERKVAATAIYQKHLGPGAPEPVNVDSRAQLSVQEGLEEAAPDLFVPAQKQIFNLMKFDCYQRFLKSELFKQCMLREVQGKPVFPEAEKEAWKLHKEDKRRRSFLPWHKNLKLVGSKLGERAAWARRSSKKKKTPKESTASDLTSSHSSLASSEASLGLLCSASRESLTGAPDSNCILSRVILPDGSSTVVRVHRGETVGAMLMLLLQKRSLTYSVVDIFVAGSDKPISPNVDVTMVGCKEIHVEPRAVFCVILPNSKMLGVKAVPRRSCGEVLRPVLAKYSVQLEHVNLRMFPVQGVTLKPLSSSALVADVDGQHIVVQFKENGSENRSTPTVRLLPHGESVVPRFLDAIHDGKVQFDDLGVTDLDILFPPVVELRQCGKSHGMYLPPSALRPSIEKSPLVECLRQRETSPRERDDARDLWVCRELVRNLDAAAPSPPPPLPPKAKQRGPPPRPPSRPQGGYLSDDEEPGLTVKPLEHGEFVHIPTKTSLTNHDCNISFV